LGRLTNNDTNEKALKELKKLFDGTGKDPE
jgi:hypothetical protein